MRAGPWHTYRFRRKVLARRVHGDRSRGCWTAFGNGNGNGRGSGRADISPVACPLQKKEEKWGEGSKARKACLGWNSRQDGGRLVERSGNPSPTVAVSLSGHGAVTLRSVTAREPEAFPPCTQQCGLHHIDAQSLSWGYLRPKQEQFSLIGNIFTSSGGSAFEDHSPALQPPRQREQLVECLRIRQVLLSENARR